MSMRVYSDCKLVYVCCLASFLSNPSLSFPPMSNPPENSSAFSDLMQRGTHAAFRDLEERFPLQSRKLSARLCTVCSALAHWSPVLAEAAYLPSLVFPFLLIFGPDELASLETVMTLYMYWGISWHASHPNVPLHLCTMFVDIVTLYDPNVASHCAKHDVSIGLLCWQMLSTMFSEICPRSVWLRVLDKLFTDFTHLSQVVLMVVAIVREVRGVILLADTQEKVVQSVRSQQSINMNNVLGYVKDMKANTPEKFFMALASKVVNMQHVEMEEKRAVKMSKLCVCTS
ncbi:hypothetical protein EON63_23970 [archaeon]|nr:MAG: hypothetical protein EON63_23970 [archaeon]